MGPTELKMQPTIHFHSKPVYEREKYPGLLSKCIVGCIYNFVGLIITREISSISRNLSEFWLTVPKLGSSTIYLQDLIIINHLTV
jgi:hypothetical protein